MTERVYPEQLKDCEIWVVWARDSKGRKRPRAPWLDGHCYPAAWGADAERRPETDFETALKYAELRGPELDAMGCDFEPDIPEETLEPGLILPHDADELKLRLVQVDLDDVRDPETGELHPEAERIVDAAGAYGSVSVSGEGVHLLVWGRLPRSMGKAIRELDDEPFVGDSCPQVELYDHGRHVALTGDHLEGTPLEIPVGYDLITACLMYPDATADEDDAETDGGQLAEPEIKPSTDGSQSPYYEHSLLDFARPKANEDERRHEVQGAHPVHGGTSSSDEGSSNYNIDKRKNQWHCFAHDSGGGPLKMVACMEGYLRCGQCEQGALDQLSDDDFLEVCLAARDRGFDGTPPYRALVALARREGLALDDPDEGVLGRSAYSVAESIFEHY